MISATRAVVLNHLRYGESSIIAQMYTERFGRQSVLVKGVYSRKSPYRAAFFQPLHIVETTLHHRDNRRIQRISDIQMLYPFRDILFHPAKNSIALFIAEILSKTLKEEESNHALFGFLLQTIQTLDLLETGIANFHLIFLLHYTRYLGFYPHLEEFPVSDASMLSQLLDLSFEHPDKLCFNHHQRNSFTEFLLSYYALHVDNFGKIRSFPVLQHVFS
ncbi:MAG: DNA repair protein RecO [Bacteroidales bacterium]|jgi:DNA repair protein RecO (recombination protein O)|nr:DNA repair protein RecO [Bacteroidales bacterium]